MLIQFTVGNYRSFKDPVTLSMEAAAITSANKELDTSNVIAAGARLKLLTSAGIYGANASGKSNLINALYFMHTLIINSARESQASDPIDTSPFRLLDSSEKRPSFFEVMFVLENQKYRYGFEVNREKVVREWLYVTPTIREAMLFQREGENIEINERTFREGRSLEQKTRANALFLSVAAHWNGAVSLKLIGWFRKLGFIYGPNNMGYKYFTISRYLENPERSDQIKNIVRLLDVEIEKIVVRKVDPDQVKQMKGMPDDLKKYFAKTPGNFLSPKTIHNQLNEKGEITGQVEFDLEGEESAGTEKLVYIAGPVLDSLANGRVMVVDELEAHLHPILSLALVRLFNSLETNPKRAQLAFTTHDTNLLDNTLLRRDQVWFTEKDSRGASHLYSLVEFNPRQEEAFERNYLRGKYGAVPYLGNFPVIFKSAVEQTGEVKTDGA
jgi:uncharacterized protein